MFTGIVEVIGTVSRLIQHDETSSGGGGTSLTISNCADILTDCHLGDSISVNGTCLTVTEFGKDEFKVGVAPETLRRTNLGSLEEGSGVNLERALRPDTRMGGHGVQGHVDTIAVISETRQDGNAISFRMKPRDNDVLRYIVEKGYITLDGASLTITAVNDDEGWFEIMMIAYTQEKVVMGRKKQGDDVNVEVDMAGKYVEKSVAAYFQGNQASGGAMLEKMVSRMVDERLKSNVVESDNGYTTDHFAAPSEEELPNFVSLFEAPAESVCDFGDVVLVVDDGFLPQLKVKVSSAILACFSKVFRALFSSRFAEGQGVQAGVKEVAISDDPRALLSLCRILHRKTLLDRHIGTASALLDFALIVDKYDCVEIIKHELEGLLRNLERCPDWDIRYGTASMLTAAYLLDQPEDFRRLTRSLVLKEPSSLYSLGERCEELLPTTILTSLKAQQDFVQRGLTLALSTTTDRFSTAAYMSQKPNLSHTFLQNLKAQGLWPLDFRHAKLDAIAESLRSVHIPILQADAYHTTIRSGA